MSIRPLMDRTKARRRQAALPALLLPALLLASGCALQMPPERVPSVRPWERALLPAPATPPVVKPPVAPPAAPPAAPPVVKPPVKPVAEPAVKPIAVAVPVQGQAWTSSATGMEFVWVDALKMWVGKYEATNAEYRKMKPDHYSDVYDKQPLNGNRQPVARVNFFDAREYAEWMTQQDRGTGHLPKNLRYRLPSEEEWQAFAQCRKTREFPWGDKMPPKFGNYADETAGRSFQKWNVIAGYDDGSAASCPVERSGQNDWDLYGVGGNVWEATAHDASGKDFGAWRGASWRHDYADYLRCAYRSARDGGSIESDFGFRLVMAPSAP